MTTQKMTIIGTNLHGYSAWEPATWESHATLMTIDGQRMGRVGTRRLPRRLENLPAMTQHRLDAVSQWHREQYEEAYMAIVQDHPHLGMNRGLDARRSMGRISRQR